MDAAPRTDLDWSSRRATLAGLVADLERMSDDSTGLLGTAHDAASPAHGWSVPRRLAFARRLAEGFAPRGEFLRHWEHYPELDLAPVMGLVPIGRDPASGRWEFAHLMTGTIPQRDANGQILRTETMAVVLILMPEDSFLQGAQSDDPEASHYDERPPRGSSPVREVRLSRHLLSKYEMTQQQWLHLTGASPSRYRPGAATWQKEWLFGSQAGWTLWVSWSKRWHVSSQRATSAE